MQSKRELIVQVVEVRGNCPAYNIGDAFKVIDGFKLVSKRPLCLHSIASLMPYYVALSHGVKWNELGLAKQGDVAYIQCLDPCDRTGGGTVVFAIRSK
jgi:uncharacterized repeat protein (TIGR04076 family)